MKDELISFETAKLAKEKGFDLKLYSEGWEYEDKHGDTFWCNCNPTSDTTKERFNIRKEVFCTQSLLQRWLREKHDIDVLVSAEMVSCDEMYTVKVTHKTKAIFPCVDYILLFEYEDVLEYGLNEALKLVNA